MEITAKEIMTREFDTINQDALVLEAVEKIMNGKVRPTGHKTVSLMVTDEVGMFTGMISVLDILYHLRPPMFEYVLEQVDIKLDEIPMYLDRFKGLKVEQVMNSTVPTVGPDDHILRLIDLMVKKKVRNLPVLENSKVVGIVYISEVFIHVGKNWLISG